MQTAEPIPATSGIANFRDLGGHLTADGGRVRPGLAFRSTDLHGLPAHARDGLERLGIRRVYDLRTRAERRDKPERAFLPPGAAYIVLDVIRDAVDGSPARLFGLFEDPGLATIALGGGRGAAMFARTYREFVSLPSARAAYGRLFRGLAAPGRTPAVVHCTTGKDRTGWAAAALQLLLGVDEETVFEDFLASNSELRGTVRPWLQRFAEAGGDPAVLEPLVTVRRSYLEGAMDEVRVRFGGLEEYFAVGLGVAPAVQRRLRDVFREPG